MNEYASMQMVVSTAVYNNRMPRSALEFLDIAFADGASVNEASDRLNQLASARALAGDQLDTLVCDGLNNLLRLFTLANKDGG